MLSGGAFSESTLNWYEAMKAFVLPLCLSNFLRKWSSLETGLPRSLSVQTRANRGGRAAGDWSLTEEAKSHPRPPVNCLRGSGFFWTFASNSLQFVRTPSPEGWTAARRFSFAGRVLQTSCRAAGETREKQYVPFKSPWRGLSEPLGFLLLLSSLQAACTLPYPLCAGLVVAH